MSAASNASVLDVLEERGFIYQTTDDPGDRDNLRKLLQSEPVTVYVGIDPTASSIHVGTLVQIMAMTHLQRAGHRPIVIVGGGTGLVGDPSGKTEMRKVLGRDSVDGNVEALHRQLSGFLDFGEGKAILLNNADWLTELNYLEFLRDVGRHFRVNVMLSHDCFKSRLESQAGLSFLEFNYMLLQAYDFCVLERDHGCRLQIGGSDQWGNIVAGVDLIRKMGGKESFGLTIPLLMTPGGQKMGKTEKGAVWVDGEQTSPYDYYQFWINVADSQVGQLLRLYTFLDLERIAELERLEGAEIREAKQVLAFEATTVAHGREEAEKARDAARKLFSTDGGASGVADMPTHSIEASSLDEGVPVFALAHDGGLSKSRGEARRLAKQGGLYLNDDKVGEDRVVTRGDLQDDDSLLLRAGKKRYLRVVLK